MPPFVDRVVIVTGAASGIGSATVERIEKEGGIPVIWDVTDVSPPPTGSTQVVDVSDPSSVEKATNIVVEEYGRIDGLVNCAGIMGFPKRLADQKPENFHQIFATNTESVFLTIRSVVPYMVAAGGGSIVNISSNAALYSRVGLALYSASKAAVIALTRNAALEYGTSGVRINAVCPGGTKTPMVGSLDSPEIQELIEKIPLGRFAEPEEIANMVYFLLSDEASYTTGSVFVIDGGMRLVGGG